MRELVITFLYFLQSFGVIVWILSGLVQFAGVYAFFGSYLDWWFIFAAPIALILGQIPVIGTILGIMGAMNAWHWDFLPAVLVFCSTLTLMVLVAISNSLINVLKK